MAAVLVREGSALRLRALSGVEFPLAQLAFQLARGRVPGFDAFPLAVELGDSPSARAVLEGGRPLLGLPLAQVFREGRLSALPFGALAHVLGRYGVCLYPLVRGVRTLGIVCYVLPADLILEARPSMELCARQLSLCVAACLAQEENQTAGPEQWAETLGPSEAARAEFLSAVAHELKTPISYVKNAAGLLRHERYRNDSSMVAELTQTIEQGMSRLNRRVDGLLSLAGAAPGPPVEAWEMGPLVREGVESVCALAEARQQALDLALPLPPAPIYGWVHAESYLAALQNVLDNAVKYTPPGGHVSVQLRAEGSRAVALVSDSGPGIPRELWERIFDPFFRHLPRAANGLGLGLPIARSCLRAMGGELWVECSSIQGTTFALAVGAADAASEP